MLFRSIQALKPAGLPKTVVYPFGGGDLISALTTYPEANDYTTLSLEHAKENLAALEIELTDEEFEALSG